MEIGSEFWTESFSKTDSGEQILVKDSLLTMSGRAAIDLIIRDIKKFSRVNTVYFPDYCCSSMLEPFINNNITPIFYSVSPKKGGLEYKIDTDIKCDIFFAMSYFGYESSNMDKYTSEFSSKGIITVEDLTHRLLSQNSGRADYSLASLRKWFPVICGGMAVKRSGSFNAKLKQPSADFIRLKQSAMDRKSAYIKSQSNDENEKSIFLSEFAESNRKLAQNYRDMAIDPISESIVRNTDIKAVRKIRQENAKALYTLKCPDVKFMFAPDDDACPLFVPVLTKKRGAIREILTKNGIYCPAHWPRPFDTANALYDTEISLVCDQRYTPNDMKKIIELIESGRR